jgi:hypothetical protein
MKKSLKIPTRLKLKYQVQGKDKTNKVYYQEATLNKV